MSWSVNAVGKAPAVKASLATQFESAKKNTQHIQPEAASVAYVEASVNALLDGFDPKVAVKVSANGSCMSKDGVLGSASTRVEFETLYGFCE